MPEKENSTHVNEVLSGGFNVARSRCKDAHCQPLYKLKFWLVPMGVLAPGSAHARPSARPPHRRERKFFGTRGCRVAFGLQNGQNRIFFLGGGGAGGFPEIFFFIGILIFL